MAQDLRETLCFVPWAFLPSLESSNPIFVPSPYAPPGGLHLHKAGRGTTKDDYPSRSVDRNQTYTCSFISPAFGI